MPLVLCVYTLSNRERTLNTPFLRLTPSSTPGKSGMPCWCFVFIRSVTERTLNTPPSQVNTLLNSWQERHAMLVLCVYTLSNRERTLNAPFPQVNTLLNSWQERHAMLVLSKVEQLQHLRFALCPK